MSKLTKQVLISATIAALSVGSLSQVPVVNGIYDMRPKNHFRGGSRGKGGKIKYARR
jgi:hypothetical protein